MSCSACSSRFDFSSGPAGYVPKEAAEAKIQKQLALEAMENQDLPLFLTLLGEKKRMDIDEFYEKAINANLVKFAETITECFFNVEYEGDVVHFKPKKDNEAAKWHENYVLEIRQRLRNRVAQATNVEELKQAIYHFCDAKDEADHFIGIYTSPIRDILIQEYRKFRGVMPYAIARAIAYLKDFEVFTFYQPFLRSWDIIYFLREVIEKVNINLAVQIVRVVVSKIPNNQVWKIFDSEKTPAEIVYATCQARPNLDFFFENPSDLTTTARLFANSARLRQQWGPRLLEMIQQKFEGVAVTPIPEMEGDTDLTYSVNKWLNLEVSFRAKFSYNTYKLRGYFWKDVERNLLYAGFGFSDRLTIPRAMPMAQFAPVLLYAAFTSGKVETICSTIALLSTKMRDQTAFRYLREFLESRGLSVHAVDPDYEEIDAILEEYGME